MRIKAMARIHRLSSGQHGTFADLMGDTRTAMGNAARFRASNFCSKVRSDAGVVKW